MGGTCPIGSQLLPWQGCPASLSADLVSQSLFAINLSSPFKDINGELLVIVRSLRKWLADRLLNGIHGWDESRIGHNQNLPLAKPNEGCREDAGASTGHPQSTAIAHTYLKAEAGLLACPTLQQLRGSGLFFTHTDAVRNAHYAKSPRARAIVAWTPRSDCR